MPPTASRGSRRLLLPSLLIVLLLAGGGLWWWKSTSTAAGGATGAASGASAGGGNRRFGGMNRVQPVSVAPARRRDIAVSVNAIGSIAAANTATVRPQVSGVLQRLSFREGEPVRAGQVIAQIDPRAFQATLAQAEGTLARDKAQVENARIDLNRYRDLLAKDAIAQQQVDTQAALVRQLEGTVKADQASVDSAALQLSYTKVTAPISGRAGLKQADLGNVVSPSDTNGIVVITQTQPAALVFSVPATHVNTVQTRLKDKQPLAVEAWDRGGTRRLATGTLATLDNSIDASTDTIKLKALFPNADGALFPNQAVSVKLQLDVQSGVLAVPQAALLRGAQGFYVWVVGEDSSVATRVVKPGASDGDWVAVEGPLRPGERVVIDGVDRLRDGAKVEVIAADPSQRAGASAPAGRGSGGNGGGGGNWRDRVPPDVAAKLEKMSPEERRAWFQQRRAASAAAGGASAP